MVPTREFLGRGKKGYDRSCRNYKAKFESLSYILGQCPTVQRMRIVRHNKICDLLVEEAKGLGWKIFHEPQFRNKNNQLRKPYLVLVRGECGLVVDVSVRYEF